MDFIHQFAISKQVLGWLLIGIVAGILNGFVFPGIKDRKKHVVWGIVAFTSLMVVLRWLILEILWPDEYSLSERSKDIIVFSFMGVTLGVLHSYLDGNGKRKLDKGARIKLIFVGAVIVAVTMTISLSLEHFSY